MLDGNRLRIWYSGHNVSSINNTGGLNDTTYNVHFIGNELHVYSGYWGIGTSEFMFTRVNSVDKLEDLEQKKSVEYFQNTRSAMTINRESSILNIYATNGQLLYRRTFTNRIDFDVNYDGLILINVTNNNSFLTEKFISTN